MTPTTHRAPSRTDSLVLLPPPVDAKLKQMIAGSVAAVLLLVLLLSFVNVVQAQVVRGEQLRQNWNVGSADAATPIAATTTTPDTRLESRPSTLAVSTAAPRAETFRF